MRRSYFFGAFLLGTVLCLSGCADRVVGSRSLNTVDPESIRPACIETLESLKLQLNISTRKQVEDILTARGHTSISHTNVSVSNSADNLPPRAKEIIKSQFGAKTVLISTISQYESMKFYFDKNQKLIMFLVEGPGTVLKNWMRNAKDKCLPHLYSETIQTRKDFSGVLLLINKKTRRLSYVHANQRVFPQLYELFGILGEYEVSEE